MAGNQPDPRITCPSIQKIAGLLKDNPKHPVGLICYSEFLRNTNFGVYRGYTLRDSQGGAEKATVPTLGKTARQTAAAEFLRDDAYIALINSSHTPDHIRAYALFRAVKCFESSGGNHCSDKDIPKTTRQSWFKALKSDYPTSDWATQLRYYW